MTRCAALVLRFRWLGGKAGRLLALPTALLCPLALLVALIVALIMAQVIINEGRAARALHGRRGNPLTNPLTQLVTWWRLLLAPLFPGYGFLAVAALSVFGGSFCKDGAVHVAATVAHRHLRNRDEAPLSDNDVQLLITLSVLQDASRSTGATAGALIKDGGGHALAKARRVMMQPVPFQRGAWAIHWTHPQCCSIALRTGLAETPKICPCAPCLQGWRS